MDDYTILSPEKVYLNLNLAGVGSRFAACFIDTIIQTLMMLFSSYIIFSNSGMYLASEIDSPNPFLSLPFVLFYVITFFVLFGYYIFFETLLNGQTPGKRMMNIRVVSLDGSSVTFIKVLLRNFIRIIDTLPTMYAVGILSVFLTKKNQHLGDMVAGTVVVREAAETAPQVVRFQIPETPLTNVIKLHVHKISEKEYGVLKTYLLRQPDMPADRVEALELKLVQHFRQKMNLELHNITNKERFLKEIAAHYQNK